MTYMMVIHLQIVYKASEDWDIRIGKALVNKPQKLRRDVLPQQATDFHHYLSSMQYPKPYSDLYSSHAVRQ